MVRQIQEQESPKRVKKRSDGVKFEYQVFTLIQRFFPKALKEVYVHINDNRIIEIDVIVVHTSGIYIFEAKVKKGKITGSPTDAYWRAQHTEYKSTKFYNPLKQTESHVRHLAKRYHISPASCHTVIVFNNDADISDIRYSTDRTTTCTYNDLPNILRQIGNNRNTPVSPFILEDMYYDLAHKSGVKRLRDMHKEAVIKKKVKSRFPTKRRR